MIVDSFLYFNEKELVELRIKYLNEIIDLFVVIEADVTHQGKVKKWNFEELLKNELKNYKNKINYQKVKIDLDKAKKDEGWIFENVKGGLSWKIENMQRNYIETICKEFSSKDIILISDVDEIPSKNKIQFLQTSNFEKIAPVGFEQFLFHLNCNYLNLEKWIGTVGTTKEIVEKFKPQKLRNNRYKMYNLKQAGWSFSSFGGASKVAEKFEAFAHDEYNKTEFKSREHIKKCMDTGEDLFKRKVKKQKISKDFFPQDLLDLMNLNSKYYFS